MCPNPFYILSEHFPLVNQYIGRMVYWYEIDAINVKGLVIKTVGEGGFVLSQLLQDEGCNLITQQENGFWLQCIKFPLKVGEAFGHFMP